VDYIRVQGKWVTRQIDDDWPRLMLEARLAIEAFSGPDGAVTRKALNDNLEYAMGVLDLLLESESSREFDPRLSRFIGLMAQAMEATARLAARAGNQ
jgi:hypothetical protein